MTTTKNKLASLGVLAAAIPTVAFAQIIDHPANSGPPESSNTTLYIILAVVAVVLVGGFLLFRKK
jgi:LPXTG-motif cell wall-anchored protein